MRLNRRAALAASAAAVTASSVRAAAKAFDARDPANLLKAYARMRGGKDGELALWYYTANAWAKPADDVARIVFRVNGLTFQRLTSRPDGGIDQKMAGRGFYGDPVTNAPLEAWTNPFNGETGTPPHVKSLALQSVQPGGKLVLAGEEGNRSYFDGRIADHTVSGDTLWLTENFVGRGRAEVGRTAPTSSSLSTFTAKIADVENGDLDFVPCYLNYQSLGSWPAWMKMGDRPGMLSWQTWGHKVKGPADGPKALQEWIEARYPGFLADPGI
jgi:hypothetical protein